MKVQVEMEPLIERLRRGGEVGVVPVGIGVDDGPKVYCLINLERNEVVRGFEFTYIDDKFTNGLATVVVDSSKMGIVKEDGSFLIPPSEEFVELEVDEKGGVSAEKRSGEKWYKIFR